jgi:hypothetical protein
MNAYDLKPEIKRAMYIELHAAIQGFKLSTLEEMALRRLGLLATSAHTRECKTVVLTLLSNVEVILSQRKQLDLLPRRYLVRQRPAALRPLKIEN